jgi:hypothetical protein
MSNHQPACFAMQSRLTQRDRLEVSAVTRRLQPESLELSADVSHRQRVTTRASGASLEQIVGEKRRMSTDPPFGNEIDVIRAEPRRATGDHKERGCDRGPTIEDHL